VDEIPYMNHQRALAAQKASCILGCTESGVASRSREAILPLCSTLVQSHPEYCIQLWNGDEGGETLEQVAQRSCGCPIIRSVQSGRMGL